MFLAKAKLKKFFIFVCFVFLFFAAYPVCFAFIEKPIAIIALHVDLSYFDGVNDKTKVPISSKEFVEMSSGATLYPIKLDIPRPPRNESLFYDFWGNPFHKTDKTVKLSFVLFAPGAKYGHGFTIPLNETAVLDFEDAHRKITLKPNTMHRGILW